MGLCNPKILNNNDIRSLYIVKMYALVKELELPIIKERVLSIRNFIETKKTLDYIEQNSEYDVNLIYENMFRLAEEGQINPFNSIELEKFFEGYVVSNTDEEDDKVFEYKF